MGPHPESAIANPKSETILLAVTGTSPAILTETIWALAQEKPAVIPHRVVVITTTAGKAAIEGELSTPTPYCDRATVWEALRQAVLGQQSSDNDLLIMEQGRLIPARGGGAGRAGKSTLTEAARLRGDSMDRLAVPAPDRQARLMYCRRQSFLQPLECDTG